jgi:ABC-type multidrug transport system fused ATPase/permease subunit
VVLEKGEIVEMGSHGELLDQDGVYRRLYDMQFMHREQPLKSEE